MVVAVDVAIVPLNLDKNVSVAISPRLQHNAISKRLNKWASLSPPSEVYPTYSASSELRDFPVINSVPYTQS